MTQLLRAVVNYRTGCRDCYLTHGSEGLKAITYIFKSRGIFYVEHMAVLGLAVFAGERHACQQTTRFTSKSSAAL